MSFWCVFWFAVGYLLRHLDTFRIHEKPNALQTAMQQAEKAAAAKQAEAIAKALKVK